MTAYALEGPSWASHVITYAYGDTTTIGSAGTTHFSGAIGDAYKPLITLAMQAWEAVADVTFKLVSSTVGADLDLGWETYANPSQLGETEFAFSTSARTGKQTFAAGAFVGFLDPAARAVGTTPDATYAGSAATLFATIQHELGHALGLAHSDDPATLMYPYLGPTNGAISAGDAAGLQALYGAPTLPAPAIPAVLEALFNGYVTTATPTLTGSAIAGDTVTILETRPGATPLALGTTIADTGGRWSLRLPGTMDGRHSFFATQTAPNGRVSAPSTALVLTVDATAPAAPTGLSLRSVTADQKVVLQGDPVEANAHVVISDGGAAIAAGDADASGRWAVTLTLAAGPHALTATATDRAGHVSAPSPALVLDASVTLAAAPAATAAPAPGVHTVYRFFDSRHGTQFLTASEAERDTVIATRPDLTFEGKAMGSVDADPADPAVSAVFRFFDTGNGTHFFTTDIGERDSILATRPDLALEDAKLYEHAAPRPGDTAVYRFFNTGDGSHFFTADATERAGLALSRPDMVAEGVAFYAPSV